MKVFIFGGDFAPRRSWYVAGGYGTRQSDFGQQGTSPAWFGNSGVVVASGYLRTQLFVQFVSGRIPGNCSNDLANGTRTCSVGQHASAVSLGISMGRQAHK